MGWEWEWEWEWEWGAKTTTAGVDPSLDAGGWFESAIPLRTAASTYNGEFPTRHLQSSDPIKIQI